MMAPSSKSMAHRLLICAGLCQGVSHIRCMDFNADILATIACLRALGVVCVVAWGYTIWRCAGVYISCRLTMSRLKVRFFPRGMLDRIRCASISCVKKKYVIA
jgi:hypothetical protein